ncbi:hypothetical protein E4U55_003207 [Claviceps digitariae]|nr:hypothetical protein E4U55_003207 [Claviceps digitariae]
MKFLSLAWVGAAVAGVISSPDSSLVGRSSVPSTFSWTSTQPVIYPKNDGHGIQGIKDPSVVFYDGKYHVFASAATKSKYNLVYLSFSDWSEAESADFFYLDQSGMGAGWRAAPQVFYHSKQKLWYLVYQGFGASYSTNPDINNPKGWSASKSFYTTNPPATVKKNMGQGNWVDFWVICDSSYCHMFSSDDNGNLYRAQTSASSFPAGFGEPVVVLHEANKWDLFEASNIYNVGGSYLLVVEAADKNSWRYFRSWTASSLTGKWTPLAATNDHPFLGMNNVKFSSGSAWTKAFSHGEVVRSNVDETMTINPCKMQYLYQGFNPAGNGVDYNILPYKLALATQQGGC